MDVVSYLLGKNSVGGGGGSLNEYFASTITAGKNLDDTQWNKLVKKIPPLVAEGTSLNYAFRNCKYVNLTEIPYIDITNVLSFKECFCYANIQNIDLSNWNFNVNSNDFNNMFSSCDAENINVSSINEITTTSMVNFYGAFRNCPYLKKVNLSNFSYSGTGNVNFYSMFSNSSKLEEIDISSFDFANATFYSSANMFDNVPTNCLIYVKDQNQVDWFTTNYPSLTNVQIK